MSLILVNCFVVSDQWSVVGACAWKQKTPTSNELHRLETLGIYHCLLQKDTRNSYVGTCRESFLFMMIWNLDHVCNFYLYINNDMILFCVYALKNRLPVLHSYISAALTVTIFVVVFL